ncbi:MAG: aspartate carbamoyltransferase [Chloroflexi bacterium]|nr:MAG: aspartate carbamoyltransferase [Chloroflexi bacterium OLB13]MBC6955295.1 aspartate carbamoyltransferase [Chloroflexota bacterium]MBV6435885.1 Aspartate carbamoyltransferase [Anaerolineae bacterium]MDL1915142.1 aspartate carbamoyltransferase [Anaerolineae bacterium CFX4]OQY86849.1 MAG: aspartate carbamoyltransferase [Anaerolineae bacterium UTCFX5]
MSDDVADPRTSVQFRHVYTPKPIAGDFVGKHIITVEQFGADDLERVMRAAGGLRERVLARDRSVVRLCEGRIMASLFYEASTRTDMSFQAAMRRLGGSVVMASNGVQFSSVYKGENLADTVRAAGCYADVITLRHPMEGSSFQAAYYIDRLNERILKPCSVVSGGDGIGEHPTQGLLDLFTILDQKQSLDGLTITLVGDLLYGRTVHSLAKLIALYHKGSTRLNFVAPSVLRMPDAVLDYVTARGVQVHETEDLRDVVSETDVVYWTRVQQERFEHVADYEAVRDQFIMTPALLNQFRRDVILMHPLPRKHEMGSLADHDLLDQNPRAVYFQEMENGMFVRMALLALVLGADVD